MINNEHYQLKKSARIYIYADRRITNHPDWLEKIFKRTNDQVLVSDSEMDYFEVWSCDSEPGKIRLPGLQYKNENGDNRYAMYVVAFEKRGGDDHKERCSIE